MKRISFNKFLLVFFIFAGTYSCKNIMDFHQEFIKNGEIVYLAKLDSVVSYSGKGRVQLSGYLNNAFNVNKIMVYWNNKADSMAFNYAKVKDTDSLNLIIPNLEEKSYIFDIYTVNNVGNRSIKVSVAGTSYGKLYRDNLAPRTSKGFSFDGKILKSIWLAADALEKGTQISYTTESNTTAILFLPKDSTQIVLTNQKYGTSLSYQTVYVPEKTSIDTFYTALTVRPVIYNPYIGDFVSTGTITDPANTTRSILRDKLIRRIDDVTSEMEVGDMASKNYYLKLVVNSDNSVTLTPSGSTPNLDQSVGVNKYDPATKTFTLNYSYNSAAPQVVKEVVTRVNMEKVSKTGWSIVGFDSQEPKETAPSGLATATIDDKLNTYWHTQWSGGTPPYPHWFIVDMGKDVTIACIEVFRRQGKSDGQTKHQFLYSSNGTDWTNFGIFAMDPTTNAGQKFRMSTSPTARYIKYVALQGPNYYANLAEINVYTPSK